MDRTREQDRLRFSSRRRRRTFGRGIVPLLLALAAPATAEPCPEVPGLAELDGADVAMFGEIHGTVEIPRFVGDVVCATSAKRPVTLGLEVPFTETAAFDAYLASAGDEAARRALVASPFFARGYQDGRSSRAMLELIDRLRALRAAGRDVAILLFDDPEAAVGRDRAMADRLLAARELAPDRLFVALAGNLHSRIIPGSPFDAGFVSMGSFLLQAAKDGETTARLVAFDALYPDGSAWTCTSASPADCGARRLRGREVGSPGLRRHPPGGDAAYHGVFAIASLTASPPAKAP